MPDRMREPDLDPEWGKDEEPSFDYSTYTDYELVMERNGIMDDIAGQREIAGKQHPGTAAHSREWETVYHMQVELKKVIAELNQRGIK